MPLVRVSLLEGKPDSFKQKVADSIQKAMVETVNALSRINSRSSPNTANQASSMP